MQFTKLDYCQYLLSSQVNYTLTNLADYLKKCSHDTINPYLRREKLTPHLLWENVKNLIKISEKAAVIFDDTVFHKKYSQKIEIARRQYSGNEHRVIEGIGVVNCVYSLSQKDEVRLGIGHRT
jgi:lipid II:glycine glycyltransferase (peptidoglycan interpeptide bridge formation enzyme)